MSVTEFSPRYVRRCQRLDEEHRQALNWIVLQRASLERDAIRFIDDEDFSVELLHAMLEQWSADWNDRAVSQQSDRRILNQPIWSISSEREFYMRVEVEQSLPDHVTHVQLLKRRFAAFTRVALYIRHRKRRYTFSDFLWQQNVERRGVQHIFNYLEYYSSNVYYILQFVNTIFSDRQDSPASLLEKAHQRAERAGEARLASRQALRAFTLQILSQANRNDFSVRESVEVKALPLQATYHEKQVPTLNDSLSLDDIYIILSNLLQETYFSVRPPHHKILLFSIVISFEQAYQEMQTLVELVCERLKRQLGFVSRSFAEITRSQRRILPTTAAEWERLHARTPTEMTSEELRRLVLDRSQTDAMNVDQRREMISRVRKELLWRTRFLLVQYARLERALKDTLDSFAVRDQLILDLTSSDGETELQQLISTSSITTIEPNQLDQALQAFISTLNAPSSVDFPIAGVILTERDYRSLAHYGLFLTSRLTTFFCRVFLSQTGLQSLRLAGLSCETASADAGLQTSVGQYTLQ